MPYLIVTRDKPDHRHMRRKEKPGHVAFLERNKHLILAAGAMLEEGEEVGFGGVIILDVETRAEAEAFIAADPYSAAGLFQSVDIVRWRKGFFDREMLPR